jgi:hypothetical protein
VIQFCDRNAEDIPSFFEGEDPSAGADPVSRPRARWATHGAHELMDPIRLLDDRGHAPASSSTVQAAPAAPPLRVWDSIEATLRKDGLIS